MTTHGSANLWNTEDREKLKTAAKITVILQYLRQFARNTAADSYTAKKKRACNNSRWRVANQLKDFRVKIRRCVFFASCLHIFRPSVQTHNDNNKSYNII
jgi:hypothetical protein